MATPTASEAPSIEFRPKALRESQHVVDKSGIATADSKADKARQRVQPLMNARNIPVRSKQMKNPCAERERETAQGYTGTGQSSCKNLFTCSSHPL